MGGKAEPWETILETVAGVGMSPKEGVLCQLTDYDVPAGKDFNWKPRGLEGNRISLLVHGGGRSH